MPRRLDILVPMYNEGQEVVKPLLDSIALQRQVNFDDIGVIICCDGGSTEITDEFMSQYPFHIEFHMCEHKGVSATRNACFDLSEAEYVSWADCDDMYCDVCGLSIVYREMDSQPNQQELAMSGLTANQVGTGFDVLVSCFREETMGPNNEIVYINRDNDFTFCHGKYYKRQYLIDKNIRWRESLYIHEDSFFQILARECAAPLRAKYCPMPFYLWCWRDQSVCRHDPKYILKTFVNMLESNDALVDEFTRRMMPDKANFYATMMVIDTFYTLNKQDWVDNTNAEYREKTERRFASYYRKHKAKWEAVPDADKMMISQGIRQRSIQEGMLREALTWDQWLAHIEEAYPEV